MQPVNPPGAGNQDEDVPRQAQIGHVHHLPQQLQDEQQQLQNAKQERDYHRRQYIYEERANRHMKRRQIDKRKNYVPGMLLQYVHRIFQSRNITEVLVYEQLVIAGIEFDNSRYTEHCCQKIEDHGAGMEPIHPIIGMGEDQMLAYLEEKVLEEFSFSNEFSWRGIIWAFKIITNAMIECAQNNVERRILMIFNWFKTLLNRQIPLGQGFIRLNDHITDLSGWDHFLEEYRR